jgi:hypothetical protein
MNSDHTVLIPLLEQTKSFLIENPTETKTIAARVFNVNVKTLVAFINRVVYKKKIEVQKKNEEQNKMLNDQEEKAIDNFVRSLLIHEISPTSHVVFNAIVCLKRGRDFTDVSPTRR